MYHIITHEEDKKQAKEKLLKEQHKRYRKSDKGRYTYYLSKIRKYGLVEEDIRCMMDKQRGCCAVCDDSLYYPGIARYVTCHIDHCHSTGKFRGLLCKQCNWGIGNLKDNIEILKNAIRYLNE